MPLRKLLITASICSLMLSACQPNDKNNTLDEPAAEAAVEAKRNCPLPAQPLPNGCTPDVYCSDAACQNAILDRHRVTTEADLDQLIKNHHDPMYAPYKVALTEIRDIINVAISKCDSWAVELEDDTNEQSNDSLNFSLRYNRTKVFGKTNTIYSLALLKAVCDIPNADTLYLYKGQHADGCPDYVFKAVATDGTVVYCADLAGLYP